MLLFVVGGGLWPYLFTYAFWEFLGYVVIADFIVIDFALIFYITYRHYFPRQ